MNFGLLFIDLTANPLPEGYYFLSVIIQLNGCQVSINNIALFNFLPIVVFTNPFIIILLKFN